MGTMINRRRVMGSQDFLPKGVVPIEYLESTGTQWVNTQFVNTLNTTFNIDFQLTDGIEADKKIIGNSYRIGLATVNGHWRVIGRRWVETQFNTDSYRHIAYNSIGGDWFIDSTKLTTINVVAAETPMAIFAAFNNSIKPDGRPAIMKLYSCKIYDMNILVRDYIPVRIGTTGYVYDKISGQLLGNAGTGDFILGPDK